MLSSAGVDEGVLRQICLPSGCIPLWDCWVFREYSGDGVTEKE